MVFKDCLVEFPTARGLLFVPSFHSKKKNAFLLDVAHVLHGNSQQKTDSVFVTEST